jgi:hypothetical protein
MHEALGSIPAPKKEKKKRKDKKKASPQKLKNRAAFDQLYYLWVYTPKDSRSASNK